MLRSSVFRGITRKNSNFDPYDDEFLSFEAIYTPSTSEVKDAVSEKQGRELSPIDIESEDIRLSTKNKNGPDADIDDLNKMSSKTNGNSDILTVISDNSNPSSDDEEVSRETLAFGVESNITKSKVTPRTDFELPYTSTSTNNSPRASYFINNLLGVRTRTEPAMDVDDTTGEEFVEMNPLRSSFGRQSNLTTSSTDYVSAKITKSTTSLLPLKATLPSEVQDNDNDDDNDDNINPIIAIEDVKAKVPPQSPVMLNNTTYKSSTDRDVYINREWDKSFSLRQSPRSLAPIKEEKLKSLFSSDLMSPQLQLSSSKKRVLYNERDELNITPRHNHSNRSSRKAKSAKSVPNNNSERDKRDTSASPRRSPRQTITVGSALNSKEIVLKPGQLYFCDKFSNTSDRSSRIKRERSTSIYIGVDHIGGTSSKSNTTYSSTNGANSSKSTQSVVSSKSNRSNNTHRNNNNIHVISLGIPNLQLDNCGRISSNHNDQESNSSRSSSRNRRSHKSSSRQELMNIPLAQRFTNTPSYPSYPSSTSSKSKRTDTDDTAPIKSKINTPTSSLFWGAVTSAAASLSTNSSSGSLCTLGSSTSTGANNITLV